MKLSNFLKQGTKIKSIFFMAILLLCLIYGEWLLAENRDSEDTITERIKPVGQVDVAKGKDEVVANTSNNKTVASEVKKTLSGQEVYDSYCTVCHSAGVAGAPKKGDETDWQPRLKDGEENLLKMAIHGLNVMPPRGTCSTCSDEELKAAIEYMLPKKG